MTWMIKARASLRIFIISINHLVFRFADIEWLKLVNQDGHALIQLTEVQLEHVIEELELGWNALTQPLRRLQQRKETSLYPDEMPCEICGESDTSNCNVIVLCDDCDLAVHQECYGVPHIPEGPWLCRTCTDRARSNYIIKPKCLMCPWPGSALRKTTDHRWVHSLCAHMISETAITFSPSDPNDLVDVCTLHSDRAKLRCVLCRTEHARGGGYPMQCTSKLCPVAFHPLCARAAGWHLDYAKQKGFCSKHAAEAATSTNNGSTGTEEPTNSLKLRLNLGNKSGGAEQQQKGHSHLLIPMNEHDDDPSSHPTSPRSSGGLSPRRNSFPLIEITDTPPLHFSRGNNEKLRLQTVAPAVLVKYIATETGIFDEKIPEQARIELVQMIARYWSLKREYRRGTPLLKTLQLEPDWTEGDWDRDRFETELKRKYDILEELHRLRDIFAILKEREEVKAEISRCSASIFQILSQPFSRLCHDFVTNLRDNVDRSGYFTYPVPLDLFPDYTSIVQYPMDFSTVLKNIASDRNASPLTPSESLYYPTLGHLYADLKLIPENSRMYNTSTSVFYLAADRLEEFMKPAFVALKRKLASYGVSSPFDALNLEATGRFDDSVEFDWDGFLANLPLPTPARFEKTSSVPNTSSSGLCTGVPTLSGFKRRGRPPKNRDSLSSMMSSSSTASVSSSSSSTSSNASSDSVPKRRRGRPRKVLPIVEESDDDDRHQGKDLFEYNNNSLTSKNKPLLVWIETSEDVWWPARVIDPNNPNEAIPGNVRRLGPRAAALSYLCRVFDPEEQWLWIDKSKAVELTGDLDADLEKLDYFPRNRRQVANAHQAALNLL